MKKIWFESQGLKEKIFMDWMWFYWQFKDEIMLDIGSMCGCLWCLSKIEFEISIQTKGFETRFKISKMIKKLSNNNEIFYKLNYRSTSKWVIQMFDK